MKKTLIPALLALLMGGALHAQTPMTIPNGSFEQWSSHPGYSVTVLIMPIAVYDTFSTPNAWNYPSYPVNQTVSFYGMNVTINTSVPIVKATRETGMVPDGNKAVKLQSVMLEDIVNPTVLNLAGSSIDTSLTQRVIPSILSTGEVDINAFIPLITSAMSDTGGLINMLPTLLAVDVNDYITGGLALGDFRPGRLTGSYKYHSAVGGDNGGVLLLGTRYNNTTHQRDIVGGGINLALVDTSVYTPFEAVYQPLGELIPGASRLSPDTLVVMLFSSAGTNMQQGSYLCLDNLMLWPAPDTCANITNLHAEPDIHEAMLSWSVSDSADFFVINYGPVGFTPGGSDGFGVGYAPISCATPSTTVSFTATGLEANTTYEFYVRTLCHDSIYGDLSVVQFTTLEDTCATVLDLRVENQAQDSIQNMVLVWRGSSQPDHWVVEYGPLGFEPGAGTSVEVDTTYYEFPQLTPGGHYRADVTAYCGDDNLGETASVEFTIPNLEGINRADMVAFAVSPNPAQGSCRVAMADGRPAELALYTIDGRLVQTVATDGSPVTLTLPVSGIYLLRATTSAGTATSKIVNK